MTSEHNGRDRRLEDELYVDALLAESGFPAGSADDGGLRDRLLRLRRLRSAEVPEPCAELVALMGGAGPGLAEVIPLEDRARRHPRKRRAVFTSLVVAASLGIAGGAAAGNETVRRHAEGTIDTIVRSFSPPAPAPNPAAPAPGPPVEAPNPAPDVVSSPLWTGPTAPNPFAAEGAPGPGRGGQKPSRDTALTTPAPEPTPPANRKSNGPRETPAKQTPAGPQETPAGPPPPGTPAEGPVPAGGKDGDKAGSDRAPAPPGTRSR